MPWWQRKLPELAGSVLYRGSPGPGAENFEHLQRSAFELKRLPDQPDRHWALEARHPTLGKATLTSLRQPTLPPADLIDFDSRLSPDHRAAIKGAGSTIGLLFEPGSDHLLKERKKFLRYLHALTSGSTVACVDHTAQSFWSPEALFDELAHDADVDILALFVMHKVQGEGGTRWMHSHGFEPLGFTEFDIVNPAEEVGGLAYDLVRALAFAVVEGEVKPDGADFQLAKPGGSIRLVSSDKVLRRGVGWPKEWPGMVDQHHRTGHAVACDPAPWLATLFGDRPRPSRFLSNPIDENLLICFSTPSSQLTAERARATYSVMRKVMEQLRGLPMMPVVKLGYVIDGGGPRDLEHLWFEVREAGETSIDATLINTPIHIARLKPGQRARHEIGLMSDWAIMTPAGRISPLGTQAARDYLERKDEILKDIAKQEQAT